jgi:Ca2+-transporting ATPase
MIPGMADDAAWPSVLTGLAQGEAQARLAREGHNELPRATRRTPWRIVLEVMREPMLVLLAAGAIVYLALGSVQEALILLVFAQFSMAVTIVQESRTERVLEALRDLTSPRALVIRDGDRVRIAGREVVRGDIVVLAEGDRVPADGVLRQAHDLQVDESLLTGESVPVRKRALEPGEASSARPGGDDLPQVYSGSLIVRGGGIAEVTATGPRSEIGRIGGTLGRLAPEPPRLREQTRRLVRLFAAVGASVSVVAVLLYGLYRGGWLDALLAGIVLGMSMLPEEFPVVLTVFMAMGAWRISRARVLTRRSAAIETLGSATVLCTDKTGTLTENRMSIVELRLADGRTLRVDGAQLPPGFDELLRFGILASDQEPFDPMERAFHHLGREQPGGSVAFAVAPGAGLDLVRAYGLRPELLAVTHVWQERERDGFLVAAKGAPEAIARLCGLAAEEAQRVQAAADAMAAEGLRVLGIARAAAALQGLPDSPHAFAFGFLGLVGLADPLRSGVREAVAECRSAGIRVIMITGDYPPTAAAIARQAGIEDGRVATGAELQRAGAAELAALVREVGVFARIMPEQKLQIVEALKSAGEIVAMTGDGVNDAASLKSAHIGIAMGRRGTDVAREASSIVLLDDDFASIVQAVRLGRRIYDNLRKAMAFIFAVHVPIAGLALLPLLTGLPIIFGPIHIAFLEMIIDPVCTLAFEAEQEEDELMRRPPRPPAAPLFPGALVAWSVLQGVLALAFVGCVYVLACRQHAMPEAGARALAFCALVSTTVALILLNRSFSESPRIAFRRPNPALKYVLLGVGVILALSLWWPVAARMFRFAPLPPGALALALGVGLLLLLVLELLKPRWRARLAG